MKADERRRSIVNLLSAEEKAIPGGELSKIYGVSRQIIVKDIAMLKAEGHNISSTHFGYVINNIPMAQRTIKTRHSSEDTREELALIVSLGGIVFDVFVWHKVYGQLTAKLNISSYEDIDKFIDGVRSGKSTELMNITGGYHYHTIRAESEEILDRIEQALTEKGFTV